MLSWTQTRRVKPVCRAVWRHATGYLELDWLPLTTIPHGILRRPKRSARGSARSAPPIGGVIFGQDEVVEQTLITLLSGGHALLIGVPGLGKTRLVETLGTSSGSTPSASSSPPT